MNSAITERIKKLLRLARSSNPHESRLAMQKALELARDYSIAVDGLNPDEQAKEKTVIHRDTQPMRRLSYDKEYAVQICQRFFRVSPIFREKFGIRSGWPAVFKYISFVGTAADCEIALYVYGFLVHHFSFSWLTHRGRLRNRHAFVDGMFHGLYSQLTASEPGPGDRHVKGVELVLAEHNAYIAATIGRVENSNFNRPTHAARAAAWAGYNRGLHTKIAPALKPSGQAAPLTLKE